MCLKYNKTLTHLSNLLHTHEQNSDWKKYRKSNVSNTVWVVLWFGALLRQILCMLYTSSHSPIAVHSIYVCEWLPLHIHVLAIQSKKWMKWWEVSELTRVLHALARFHSNSQQNTALTPTLLSEINNKTNYLQYPVAKAPSTKPDVKSATVPNQFVDIKYFFFSIFCCLLLFWWRKGETIL